MNINSIGNLNTLNIDKISPKITDNKESVSFGDYLMDAINNVNNLENDSKKLTEDFILGKTDNIHEVMIAGENASIALQFTVAVRDKLIDAYNEIMRMQV